MESVLPLIASKGDKNGSFRDSNIKRRRLSKKTAMELRNDPSLLRM
jgi:hypothetical protein